MKHSKKLLALLLTAALALGMLAGSSPQPRRARSRRPRRARPRRARSPLRKAPAC